MYSSVNRVSCEECETLLVNWGHGAFTGFVIVNNETMNRQMPSPTCDTFYSSGLKEGPITKKVWHGDLSSTIGLMYNILVLGAPAVCTRACCCIGWGSADAKVTPETPASGDSELVAP